MSNFQTYYTHNCNIFCPLRSYDITDIKWLWLYLNNTVNSELNSYISTIRFTENKTWFSHTTDSNQEPESIQCNSQYLDQRCADCGRGYPRTWIRRFFCGRGRSADPPNKHICGRGPSTDLKPQVLFAQQTSNRSANVPVLSNLRTDPYLDTAVGYVRKPVWLCGALGIGYSVIRPYLWMRTVRGHESPLQLQTRTVRRPDACGRGLSADVKFVDPHTSDTDTGLCQYNKWDITKWNCRTNTTELLVQHIYHQQLLHN